MKHIARGSPLPNGAPRPMNLQAMAAALKVDAADTKTEESMEKKITQPKPDSKEAQLRALREATVVAAAAGDKPLTKDIKKTKVAALRETIKNPPSGKRPKGKRPPAEKLAEKAAKAKQRLAELKARKAGKSPPANPEESDMRKTNKTTKAKSRVAAAKGKGGGEKTKVEIIAGLLQRKDGCTAAEVLKATGWPTVSMPQQAKLAGLKLKKEKDGKVTRYRAA